MKYAAILAGGIGSRMHSSIPKQFLNISGVPIIIRTIRRIIEFSFFDHIIVAIHPEWKEELERLLMEYCLQDFKVNVIDGGTERLDTIHNVLSSIKENWGIATEDKILIHDAVRPFISKKTVDDSFYALESHDAVVAALPVVDTMLWLEDGKMVSDMPTRSKLFHGQAPDSFRLSTLYDAFFNLSASERKIITGTAQICMMKGIDIATVSGDPMNIKITTPFDIKLAEFFCSLEN